MRLASGRLLAMNTGSGTVASTGGRGRRAAEIEEEDVLDGDLGVLPMDVVDDGEDDHVQLRLHLLRRGRRRRGGSIPLLRLG